MKTLDEVADDARMKLALIELVKTWRIDAEFMFADERHDAADDQRRRADELERTICGDAKGGA